MDGLDGEVPLLSSHDMGTELASLLMDDSVTSFPQHDLDDMLSNGSGIDLMLECEDDKTYALPSNNNNGLRLHTTNNVSMRISFSPPDSLSCRYCKCNFLCEVHLVQHMQQFHMESMDEDDDKPEDGNITSSSDLELPSSQNGGAYNPAASPQTSTPVNPNFYTSGSVRKAKPQKSKTMSANGAPTHAPLTLTIKKFKSNYEIQPEKREQSPVLSPPVMPMLQEESEAQSDSANETIDVESSSPSSSPNSVKSGPVSGFGVKKLSSGKPFTCDICKKSFQSKYALKRHVATHSEERPFVCTFERCKGAAFKLKSRLTDHIRYVHKLKTPRTQKRSKSIPVTATPSLAKALLSPSPLPTPEVDVLGNAAKSGPSTDGPPTNGSIDISTNGKPGSKANSFKCPMPNCNREFRDAYNRDTHMALHTGHMPLKCPHAPCQYRCIQKHALDWHLKHTHSLWCRCCG